MNCSCVCARVFVYMPVYIISYPTHIPYFEKLRMYKYGMSGCRSWAPHTFRNLFGSIVWDHSGVRGNERADRLASLVPIIMTLKIDGYSGYTSVALGVTFNLRCPADDSFSSSKSTPSSLTPHSSIRADLF